MNVNSNNDLQKRILLVDDDLLSQKMLSRILKIDGYKITTAKDGLIALDIIENQSFNLILSDINMPNLNGIQLLEELNRKELNIPVIFLSGEEDDNTKMKVMELGAADYLIKPVTREDLVKKINSFF